MEGRTKRRLALAIFLIVFCFNSALLYANLQSNLLVSLLYGINVWAILLLGITFLKPSYFLGGGGNTRVMMLGLNNLGAAMLFACAGVPLGCEVIIAPLLETLDRPLLLGSLLAICFTFAYAVVVRND